MAWDERQIESELQQVSIKAFGRPITAVQERLEDYYDKLEEALKNVVEKIPGTHGEKYLPKEMVDS